MRETSMNLLSDEKVFQTKNKIDSIDKEIDLMQWELAGEPEEEQYNDFDEMYENSPERHLDELYQEKDRLEEILFRDEYYKNVEKIIKNSEYETYRIGTMLTDDITDTDLFNREMKAFQTAETICATSKKGMFNIGILGEWGTGKSTFLSMIKKNLCKQKDVVVVSYDASSYSEQNQIWANFAKILFENYEQKVWFPGLKYNLAKVMISPKKYISIGLGNVIIWILLFLFVWGSRLAFSINSLISKFSAFGFSLVGILLLLSKIVFPWGKKLLETSIPLSQKVVNTVKLPSYVEKLGTREQVRDELEVLFKAWIPKDNQKVVIFVDELDRCSDKGIIEFFQALQLFYGNNKMMFVFAIEPSHLQKALSSNFEIGDMILEEYTKKYMEKYISLTVPLSNNVDYSGYVTNLIKEINCGSCLKISETELEQIQECLKCIPVNYITPRKIKKIVNLLILVKSFCVHYYSELRIEYCQLFTWIIVNCFYPEATDYIVKLYRKEREFSPLNKILSYNQKVQEKMNNRKLYYIINEYKMHDIVIYNKLTKIFSVLI